MSLLDEEVFSCPCCRKPLANLESNPQPIEQLFLASMSQDRIEITKIIVMMFELIHRIGDGEYPGLEYEDMTQNGED
tara:strand:- start:149 stop:379 length:231 start_codon:yes stop_codon:yes gene_type:complete